MKTLHSNIPVSILLTFILALTIFMSFGCRIIQFDGDGNENVTGSAVLSGRVIKSSVSASKTIMAATDLSGSSGVANAEVWLEDLSTNPNFRTITDASGTYIFRNVPEGEHRVIIKYLDVTTGETMKSRSNPVIISATTEQITVPNISGEAARNIVTGKLCDTDGNPFSEGTVLRLWGETFYVGTNGIFISPPLPESALEAEIFVTLPGQTLEKSFKAPFVSRVAPAYLELEIGTTADGNTPPTVFLSASLDGKPVSRVNPGAVVLLTAKAIDDGNVSSSWSVTSGELANGASDFEKVWTAPSFYCVATVSIEVTDPDQATAKAFLPLLVGIDNPSQVDTDRPEAVISSSVSGVQNSSSFLATISFSELVKGFDIEDIAIENGAADQFTVINAEKTFSVIVTPANAGVVTVKINENSVQDYSGNGNPESAILSVENTILSSEKSIIGTFYGAVVNGNLVDIAPETKVSQLKEGLTLSENATCEILMSSGGEVVPEQAATNVTSDMVIRVTAQDLSTAGYTITLRIPPPTINLIAPTTAATGASITITGTNFTG
ncbi:MAG: carboxypeptidase regulatory-like domain-containing protein, partial [Candidatus Riflebacteria bacterium]|nr:carboxypeptidase regulatory-like domain-containing protein [Candidatus Riflebacteria bacterium]